MITIYVIQIYINRQLMQVFLVLNVADLESEMTFIRDARHVDIVKVNLKEHI